ncbi:hypothetical protein [Rossellomorea marisflavi]|uniref:hypothetical protein n=1 Tax=Rossellomorea marisflavi TaxID=189381 RepID=UPI00065D7190|nr:hypothetical protein [Rossellomorea marisflavi]KML05585.1 hypothetical protein VL06_11425 [Rossellomorea marisflavi]
MEDLAWNLDSMADKDAPFRYGGSLSGGRQLSRFRCASRDSTLPLFPQESSRLRFNTLLVGMMVAILYGEKPFVRIA